MGVGEWRWVGQADRVEAGGVFEALVHGGDIEPHVHRVRHHPRAAILEAMGAADLECLATLGQREVGGKIVLDERPDEGRDHRTIYIARHAG